MGTVVVYVSKRDRAPYRVLVEEEVEERFDSWLNEHNLDYRIELANGEHVTYQASMVLRHDRIAYDQEMQRWVTYDTDLAYLEMPADMWWAGKWGEDEAKIARNAWIAEHLDHV